MTNFKLSEKIICMKHNNLSFKGCKWVYTEEDVKEFIRLLKKEMCEYCKYIDFIDTLAGDALK